MADTRYIVSVEPELNQAKIKAVKQQMESQLKAAAAPDAGPILDKYTQLKTRYNENVKLLKEMNVLIKQGSTLTGEQKSKYEQATVEIVKQKRELGELKMELSRIDAAAKDFNKSLGGAGKSIEGLGGKGSALKGIGDAFGSIKAAPAIGAAVAATGLLVAGMKDVIDTGSAFQDSLADLSAITGLQGAALKDLGNRARELSKEFGGDAVNQVEAFKGVLSRLGPDIGKSPEALSSMATSINTLSKAGGLDAAASMDVLTNSMLQFGVDLSNPITAADEMSRMMNVLAAGAKEGAAEIPQVGEAVVVAGTAANAAKISFEETNAAIQVLAAKSGKYGSEAGTALRNVIGLLQKNSNEAEKLTSSLGLPFEKLGQTLTTEGLGAALNELKGALDKLPTVAEKNAAVMQLFGTENAAAAMAMINNTDSLADFTTKLTGTNTAVDQAKTKMATWSESMSRMEAIFGDFKLNVFEGLAPGLDQLGKATEEAFGKISDTLSGSLTKNLETVMPAITQVVTTMINYLPDVIDLLTAMNEPVYAFMEAMFEVGDAVADVLESFGLLEGGVDPVKTAIQAIAFPFKLTSAVIREFAEWIKSAVDGLGDFVKAALQLFGVLERKAPLRNKYAEQSPLNPNYKPPTSEIPPTTPPPVIPPAGDGTNNNKAQINKLKDLSDEIIKVERATEKIRMDLAIQGIEDRFEAELQSQRDRNSLAEQSIADEIERTRQLKDVRKGEQAELIAALYEQLGIQQEANAAAINTILEKQDQARLVALDKQLEEESRKRREASAAQAELLNLEISLIGDEREREYRTELASIESNYQKQRQLALGNYELLRQLHDKYLADKLAAERRYNQQSNALTLAIAAFEQDLYMASFDIIEDAREESHERELGRKRQAAEAEEDEALKALRQKEISTREYYSKIEDIQRDHKDTMIEAEEEIAAAIPDIWSKAFDDTIKALDKFRSEQINLLVGLQQTQRANNDELDDNERELTEARQSYSQSLYETNSINERKYAAEVKALEAERLALIEQNQANEEEITNAKVQAYGAMFAQLGLAQKDWAAAAVKTAFAALKAEVPIIAAKALMKTIGEFGWPLGPVLGGLAYAAVYASLSALQGALGFKSGVVDLKGPGTETSDDIPAWLSVHESVVTARATRANKSELEWANRTGRSIVEYYIEERPEVIRSLAQSTVEREEINRLRQNEVIRATRLEHRKAVFAGVISSERDEQRHDNKALLAKIEEQSRLLEQLYRRKLYNERNLKVSFDGRLDFDPRQAEAYIRDVKRRNIMVT